MSTPKTDAVTTSGILVRPSYAPGDVPTGWDPGVPGAFRLFANLLSAK